MARGRKRPKPPPIDFSAWEQPHGSILYLPPGWEPTPETYNLPSMLAGSKVIIEPCDELMMVPFAGNAFVSGHVMCKCVPDFLPLPADALFAAGEGASASQPRPSSSSSRRHVQPPKRLTGWLAPQSN